MYPTHTRKMNCIASEATAMVSANDERIDTVQDIKNAMLNEGGSDLSNGGGARSTIVELFPWISEFKRMCKCVLYVEKTTAFLAELMQYYIRNVNVSANKYKCYGKPPKAARLKDSISETLPLFLYIYRELSENCNRSFYLNNMSDLLAVYIDMELKASRRNREDHNIICTRLISCLYVYLEHSTEHLLDTLIKTQLMYRNYHHILNPIITKIINNIPAHPDSNVMYVRYLFIYHLWRKINNGMADMQSQITTIAVASLGAPPDAFPPFAFENVLPEVPKDELNPAKYLMEKEFNIKKCRELFLQFYRKNRAGIWQEKSENATVIPSSSKKIASQVFPEDGKWRFRKNIIRPG